MPKRQPAGIKTPANNPAEPVLLGFVNPVPVAPEPSELDNAQPLAVGDWLRVVRCVEFLTGRADVLNPTAWNVQQETAVSEFNAVCLCLPIV